MSGFVPRMLVVMGVSGAGKSTVAAALAVRLGWPMLEGDDLHDGASIAMLHRGEALTDEQRLPWLGRIASWMDEQAAIGGSGVIACSALARRHRDVLRRPGVRFVHLHGDRTLLQHRVEARRHHFASPALLGSQLATLEPPGVDEDAIDLDAADTVARQVEQVVATFDE
ncbi:MAG: carbohydrate kinase [Thermoleophilia bacterium]|nr:carbohydrate kinase [Thermoleophilia bacterium]